MRANSAVWVPPRQPLEIVAAGRSTPMAAPPRTIAPATVLGSCSGCTGGKPCTDCGGDDLAGGPAGGMAGGGVAHEPFPRQVLIGNSGGPVTYLGPVYDATHWKSIAWWFEVYAGLLSTPGAPATAYLDTAEHIEGPWTEMIPGGEAGTIGVVATGVVEDVSRYLRPSVVVRAGETVALAVRLLARQR